MEMKKKELVTEEKLNLVEDRELKDIQGKLKHLNEPSYYFNIGDEVIIDNHIEGVVVEIFYNGKVYKIKCISSYSKYGNKIIEEYYRIVTWVDIRPIKHEDTSFSKNKNIHLNYINVDISQIISRYYLCGIDLNPDYQRDYVWDRNDKELLIDSIFKNIDIGKFALIRLSNTEWMKRNKGFEVLDGKQRISTIIDFYENRFAYKEVYYNDLSIKDQLAFKNHSILLAEIDEIDKKKTLEYFLLLNCAGRVMDKNI